MLLQQDQASVAGGELPCIVFNYVLCLIMYPFTYEDPPWPFSRGCLLHSYITFEFGLSEMGLWSDKVASYLVGKNLISICHYT